MPSFWNWGSDLWDSPVQQYPFNLLLPCMSPCSNGQNRIRSKIAGNESAGCTEPDPILLFLTWVGFGFSLSMLSHEGVICYPVDNLVGSSAALFDNLTLRTGSSHFARVNFFYRIQQLSRRKLGSNNLDQSSHFWCWWLLPWQMVLLPRLTNQESDEFVGHWVIPHYRLIPLSRKFFRIDVSSIMSSLKNCSWFISAGLWQSFHSHVDASYLLCNVRCMYPKLIWGPQQENCNSCFI